MKLVFDHWCPYISFQNYYFLQLSSLVTIGHSSNFTTIRPPKITNFNITTLGSLEEGQAASHDEMPLTNQAYLSPSGMYLSYPAMATGEFSENDLRAAGILPEGAIKKVVFKKQSRLNPFGHFLGTRRQFRKRENASECFWKYCV
ncbi:prepro-urotensin II-beta isoform X1 [Brienomyrus brachyistius]|uniref:prepro-urotensin II-beta isoform X1 n=1 Tax=Brienomyrus brachyistius TaxID=42636 RepID=UPI0020B2CA4E|nr:prepro-urotensin II-beta isoform X1 [Brienomyrus brachyistius]